MLFECLARGVFSEHSSLQFGEERKIYSGFFLQVSKNTVRHLGSGEGKKYMFFLYSAYLLRLAGAILMLYVPPIPLPALPCTSACDAEIGLLV